MIDKKDITGIILSGGKSKRMGTDKGFLLYGGKYFIQYSIEALKPLVNETIIVSNHIDYDVFGLNRVEDTFENYGPLAGLYSGLQHSKTKYNLVLSCDIPLIKTNILKKLIKAADNDSDIIQIESDGKTMPLIALYKKECAAIFLKLLNHNERRLQYAVNQCKVKTVVLDDAEELFTRNINTPEELNEITI
ncbi:molybdenum cofactor guanylyltransferase [Confluentibacter sediminis]|uniref:molybdenum cofactor guanylyltransferase n=1 Tax=Confluentibacter sediminis TaxID=2219045 RepID=UPI000DABF941|nr:molybdenum cofactor guanylyltransferase [Confluentibacter sediminis]